MKVFVFGTCKRGFPLHYGLARAKFCGEYRTTQPFPMLIAGPWFAPMMFNEPGVGRQVTGELYEIDETYLDRLDAMESVGKPGNIRSSIEVAPLKGGAPCMAFAYMKSRALADPIHSDYLASYHDRRFIPPARRGSP
jgi:gamma-glutamylaminecyclotransferase